MSKTTEISRVVVAGGGAWGTALASVCARAGLETTLWCRSADQAAAIAASRENALYLPGYKLPEGLAVTADETAFSDADTVVLATPAQSTRQMLTLMSPHLVQGVPMIIAAKGFERETDLMLSDVVKEAAPALVPLVLSGPSFAADVVADLPTAVTLAGEDVNVAHALASAMSRRSFRIYVSDDLKGVQTGGAVKNVIAIAAGICSGKQLGASALAALTTRSFAELRRLADVLGAKPDTLFGLSGLGDLILTCSSAQSRNFSLGVELGHGKPLKHILASRRSVSEGVYTASVVEDLARKHGIEMPVCQAVANIVNAGADVDNEIHKLLSRPLKAERD